MKNTFNNKIDFEKKIELIDKSVSRRAEITDANPNDILQSQLNMWNISEEEYINFHVNKE